MERSSRVGPGGASRGACCPGHRLHHTGRGHLPRRPSRVGAFRAPDRRVLARLGSVRVHGLVGPGAAAQCLARHLRLVQAQSGAAAQLRTVDRVLHHVVAHDHPHHPHLRSRRPRRHTRRLRHQRLHDPVRPSHGEVREARQAELALVPVRMLRGDHPLDSGAHLPVEPQLRRPGGPGVRLRHHRVAVRVLQHLRREHGAAVQEGRQVARLSVRGEGLHLPQPDREGLARLADVRRHPDGLGLVSRWHVSIKIVWVLSMAYHFVVSIILYLRYGCTIILCKEFLADNIIENTNAHGGTFLYASPMHIRMLFSDTSNRMMPSLKRVISTSTAISKDQCEKFKSRFGIPVSQAYGIIEIGLPIINFEKSELYPDAVGYALPDYTVEILDENGNILPVDQVGHLAIKGPGMLDGYLNPPSTRDQILKAGWFLTGDLASKMNDGLIRIEGRLKSMINVSGNKVFPEEVEAVLNQHPLISESKVSGYKHPLLGESVRAEIVLHPRATKPDIESLRQFCRTHLSAYKIPQLFIYVESLPKTDSGKLMRGE